MAALLAALAACALPGTAWGALELTVSPAPSVVVSGDSPTVTATVKNQGPATEDLVSIGFLGQEPDTATVTPSALASCNALVLLICSVGDLAPGASASVTVTFGPLRAGNAALQVTATNAPLVNWTTPVTSPAKLSLELAGQPASLTAGNATAVAATVKNSGAGPAFGAKLILTLPFGLTPSALPGGCAAAGLTLTCALGDLASQATSTTVIPIRPPEAGTYTVNGSASWARQTSVTGDLTIGVLSPTDPDTGGGLPTDLGGATTPDAPRTVTLEHVSRGLPGRNRCVRERVLDVLLRSPGGVDPKSATLRIGKKVVKRLKGAKARAPFTLRVPRSGRFVLRVSVTLTDGRVLNASRTYRVCRRR